MKVLIINTLYYPNIRGGAEKSTQLLAEGLQELGIEPIVASVAPTQGIGNVNGVKVFYVPLKNVYWPFNDLERNSLLKAVWHLVDIYNPLMMKKVISIIDSEHPDIVHTNNLSAFSVSIWKAVKSRGLPLIHTLRDYYLLCPRSTMFHNRKNCLTQCWNCRVYSYLKRKLSALVDQVVGISSFVLQRHCEANFFPFAEKKTIYNPVSAINQTSGIISNGKVRFGYIGRLQRTKGVEELLDAFKKVKREKATLTLAGSGGSYYKGFLQERFRSPNIAFLGFVPADDFYRQIDVLVVPSLWHEPLGRIVLEAYSHGLPVIAAKRGGISEIVEEGKTGFLFEPDNAEELESCMRKFLEEPGLSLELGQNCRRNVEEFLPANTIQQYIELYKNSKE